MDPQPWLPLAEYLVGVLDLKSATAVHAVAGKRDAYRPIESLFRDQQPAVGDPVALVQWYRGFGIRTFYLADLDALMSGSVQRGAIESLLQVSREDERWMIDLGVCADVLQKHGQWMQKLSESSRQVDWILASETAGSTLVIDRSCEFIATESLILGIDFSRGRFVGPGLNLDSWITTADRLSLHRGLVLDVAAVGTSCGPVAIKWCGDLLKRMPHWNLISGGGCRSPQDAQAFLDAGCQRCLIASALLPAAG